MKRLAVCRTLARWRSGGAAATVVGLVLPVLALALGSGCGGRGGYQADKTVPVLVDQVRDVQRTQDELARQGARTEMRIYELQMKVAQLVEQLRQAQGGAAATPYVPAPVSPSVVPPPVVPPP